MSGGYFPMKDMERRAKDLLRAALLVQNVIDDFWDPIYCGEDGQFDNAFDALTRGL
jgi:hypothetical protein